MSPYNYCANNSVKYIDPDGRKIEFAKGVSDKFKQQFAAAVKHLNKHGVGGLMKKLHDHETVIYIAEGKSRSYFRPSKRTIVWDPTMGVLTSNGTEISPTTVLNHEVDHAQQALYSPEQIEVDKKNN